jgi:hypothetical protein
MAWLIAKGKVNDGAAHRRVPVGRRILAQPATQGAGWSDCSRPRRCHRKERAHRGYSSSRAPPRRPAARPTAMAVTTTTKRPPVRVSLAQLKASADKFRSARWRAGNRQSTVMKMVGAHRAEPEAWRAPAAAQPPRTGWFARRRPRPRSRPPCLPSAPEILGGMMRITHHCHRQVPLQPNERPACFAFNHCSRSRVRSASGAAVRLMKNS